MSTTVVGSLPQGQAASRRRVPERQAAPRSPRRFRLPRASTTPGKLWLARAGLVIGCLAWGALTTLMVIQHASAAHDVAAADESLNLQMNIRGILLFKAGDVVNKLCPRFIAAKPHRTMKTKGVIFFL